MRKLSVFNQVSIDGFIADVQGDMSWAHKARQDAEWNAFMSENASGGGVLVFGRVTYDLMNGYWTTQHAMDNLPIVAERMNNLPKVVFSTTMDQAIWNNTTLIKADIAEAVRKMKQQSGPDMVILGSGSIVSQLAREGLIDEFELAVNPIVLGRGKSMFDGLPGKFSVRLAATRTFPLGNVFLRYELA